jgi:leucyl aminopeptidase
MKITREGRSAHRIRAEMLAVPLADVSRPGPDLAALDAATSGRLLRELRRRSADPAKRGAVGIYQTHGALSADLIAVIGVGGKGATYEALVAEDWRRFAGQAAGAAQAARARSLAISVAAAPRDAAPRAAGAAIEGALLAAYRYGGFRKRVAAAQLAQCFIVGTPASRAMGSSAQRARVIAEATCLARDLINAPAEKMTPAHLGQAAVRHLRTSGMTVRVMGPRELRRLGMGAILAVGRGSRNEPRLIEIAYRPSSARGRHVALVGKGITFDSGGLSLKPPQAMEIQKRDMAGGAAVIGAMSAIGRLRPAIEVRGYVATAENMPGGDAYRPGDVLRTFGGKTVEVLNTDAEGRLVLADALGYATRSPRESGRPRWMVDLATLTGAVATALGRSVAAVMGTDPGLVQAVIECGRGAGEPVWELPLVDDYVTGLESSIADLKNTGDGTAGTIFGGLFLREFVRGVPWAHLDIAGVAFADKPQPYVPRGAVGWGVRTLVALVERAAEE